MDGSPTTVNSLLENLTDPQREAVLHTDGPLLVLAGPGSGKTRVITRRAAHLAATVSAASHILAITFTNKAANEMRERIAALGVAPGMTVSTFHAFCARLLRTYHDRAGLPQNFTIFDTDDRRRVIKAAIEEAELSTSNYAPASVEQHISRAKNELLTAQDYAEKHDGWYERTIAKIYLCYEPMLNAQAGLDFDDLLMRTALLLHKDAELREQLSQRYQYILIDEYQDTNDAQYTIAKLLAEGHHNICATGDPDQSIYGWRGANIKNILSFEQDYHDARVVRLEQNFRSTKAILNAADTLIAANLSRKVKTLWTDNDDGDPVRVVECESGHDEAVMIADDIQQRQATGTALGEIAIFYRINAMSRPVEEALLKRGIAYQIARGVEFYNRKEIRDVLAYLRVLVNPADEVALLRIINTPTRGIGATTVDRLVAAARDAGKSVYDFLTGISDFSALGRSAKKVGEFAQLLATLQPAIDMPAQEAMSFVVSQSGLRAMYNNQRVGENDPIANIDELINAAAEFQQDEPDATLVRWLEHAALVSDVDNISDSEGAVTLMTLHAAKGLEFPVVYVVGLEDGILPYRRYDSSGGRDCDEEEERRLCFVGMTRAMQRLTLSHVRYRMLRGQSQRATRSGFLGEIAGNRIDKSHWRGDGDKRPKISATDGGRLPDDIEEWTIGSLVRHPVHGLGQITRLERGSKRTHVGVQFPNGSSRNWVLEFAPLTRVPFEEVG